MASLTAPNSGGNDGPVSSVTLKEVRTWEFELMEALRDARHHIDWGTGSVMDDEDPPPMLGNKMEAHGAITAAEQFIEKILDALKDVLRARALGERARREGAAPELLDRVCVEALTREVMNVELATDRMLELLHVSEPHRVRPNR